jgi:DNA-binding transcriptional ArsR family regulator
VVGVDSEDADALLSALTSGTARRILSRLHEEPAPPSRVTDSVDTSLQNVQYQLKRLEDAGTVEVVGTGYSEKGREMDLYAPADEPLVIYVGCEEQSTGIRSALRQLLGGVGALLVQEAFGEGVPRGSPRRAAPAATGARPSPLSRRTSRRPTPRTRPRPHAGSRTDRERDGHSHPPPRPTAGWVS